MYYVAMIKSGYPQFASVGPSVRYIPEFSRDVFFLLYVPNLSYLEVSRAKQPFGRGNFHKKHWFVGG